MRGYFWHKRWVKTPDAPVSSLHGLLPIMWNISHKMSSWEKRWLPVLWKQSEPVQTKPVLPIFRHPVVLDAYMSQQSVLWAMGMHTRLHQRSTCRRLKELMLPLCSGHSWSSGPSSGLPSTRDRDILERIQWNGRRELEDLSSQERLNELGLFRLEKWRLRGTFLT